MAPIKNKKLLLLLPFALCGFALAQPIYHLLLQTPVFLLARQNTRFDIWALVFALSVVLPLLLALPGYISHRRWPVFSSLWCWALSTGFAALFMGQLLQPGLSAHEWVYIGMAVGVGAIAQPRDEVRIDQRQRTQIGHQLEHQFFIGRSFA